MAFLKEEDNSEQNHVPHHFLHIKSKSREEPGAPFSANRRALHYETLKNAIKHIQI